MIDNPFLIRGNTRDGSSGAGGSAGFFLGTVSDADEDGVQILFDGDEDATPKRYKQVATGTQLVTGDRVLCAKIAGSCVVIGRIAYEQSGGGGTVDDSLSTTSENPVQNKVITNELNTKVAKTGDTMTGALTLDVPLGIGSGGTGMSEVFDTNVVADIVTPSSDVQIVSARFVQYGKVASIRVEMKRSVALSNQGATFAVLQPGKAPKQYASATTSVFNHDTNAYLDSNGSIYIHGTLAANTAIAVLATYILA